MSDEVLLEAMVQNISSSNATFCCARTLLTAAALGVQLQVQPSSIPQKQVLC